MKIDDICALAIGATREVYPRYMQKVNDIDTDYFDHIPRDSEELPESEKEYDRNTAQETLKLITKLGFKITKQ